MCVITRLYYMAAVASGVCDVLDDPPRPRRRRRKSILFPLQEKTPPHVVLIIIRIIWVQIIYLGFHNVFSCAAAPERIPCYSAVSLSLSLFFDAACIHNLYFHTFFFKNFNFCSVLMICLIWINIFICIVALST